MKRVEEPTAQVALVATSFSITTHWTLTFDKTICQKRAMLFAIKLRSRPFCQQAIVIGPQEDDVLGDLRLELRGAAAKDVETEIDLSVYFGMKRMILVAELSRLALFDDLP